MLKKKAKKRVARRKAVKRKRPAAKKAAKKRVVCKKKAALAKKPKQQAGALGIVTHYFPHVQAAVVKLKAPLSQGDVIRVKGHTTDFTQTVASMQIDHVAVANAKKGSEIGLQVNSRVRQHDAVYKA